MLYLETQQIWLWSDSRLILWLHLNSEETTNTFLMLCSEWSKKKVSWPFGEVQFPLSWELCWSTSVWWPPMSKSRKKLVNTLEAATHNLQELLLLSLLVSMLLSSPSQLITSRPNYIRWDQAQTESFHTVELWTASLSLLKEKDSSNFGSVSKPTLSECLHTLLSHCWLWTSLTATGVLPLKEFNDEDK